MLQAALSASRQGSTGEGTFEAARPGSCCNMQPHTEMSWSSFKLLHTEEQLQAPIVVPCGHMVMIDENITGLAGLHVHGSVTFQDGIDLVLETDHIFNCGSFSIGSATQPHQANVNIILTGASADNPRPEELWHSPLRHMWRHHLHSGGGLQCHFMDAIANGRGAHS